MKMQKIKKRFQIKIINVNFLDFKYLPTVQRIINFAKRFRHSYLIIIFRNKKINISGL